MGDVTVWLSDEDLAALERLADELGVSRSAALRQLISDGLRDWLKEHALEELSEGHLTLRSAAERAEVSVVEMLTYASNAGIDIGYTEDELERDLDRV